MPLQKTKQDITEKRLTDIDQWVHAQQDIDKRPLSTQQQCAKYAGIAIAPVATAIVYPYAKDFGQVLAKDVLKFKRGNPVRFMASYFGVSGMLAVSSLAAYACGSLFPEMIQRNGNPLRKDINQHADAHRRLNQGKFVASAILGNISAIPTTYLTIKHFRPLIKHRPAAALAAVTQATWGAVSAWSLYYLPGDMIDRAQRTWLPDHLKSTREKKEMMVEHKIQRAISAADTNIYGAAETPTPPSIRSLVAQADQPPQLAQAQQPLNIAGNVGIGIGLASSYFFYPLGKAAGENLNTAFKLRPNRVLPLSIGVCSFLTNAVLSARATHDCMAKSENAIVSYVKSQSSADEGVVPFALLALLAFSSSAHRTSITAKYVDLSKLFGKGVLASAVTSLVCTNYWSMDGLTNQLLFRKQTKSKPADVYQSLLFRAVKEMDDEHLDALDQTLSEMSN